MRSSTASMPLIELRAVHVSFLGNQAREEPVLAAVSMEILDGDAVGVLGPSGCGKTTLLKVIAGHHAVTSGGLAYRFDAQNPGQFGYMSQANSLLPWLDLFDNVRFPLTVLGREVDARTRVERLLREVGLSGHERKYPAELSGGMARRAVLARTLVTEPNVLLLDEPFSGLDFVTRASLIDLLARLRGTHRFTQVCVEHDLQAAAQLATKFLIFTGAGTPPRWLDCGLEYSVERRENLLRSALSFGTQF